MHVMLIQPFLIIINLASLPMHWWGDAESRHTPGLRVRWELMRPPTRQTSGVLSTDHTSLPDDVDDRVPQSGQLPQCRLPLQSLGVQELIQCPGD